MRTCLHLLEEAEAHESKAGQQRGGTQKRGGNWACAGRDVLLFDCGGYLLKKKKRAA